MPADSRPAPCVPTLVAVLRRKRGSPHGAGTTPVSFFLVTFAVEDVINLVRGDCLAISSRIQPEMHFVA